MSTETTSFVSLQRWAAAGFALLLLLSPAAPAAAQTHARRSHARTCEAPKKGKSAGAAGRKAEKKSSAASTSESSSSSQSDDTDDLSGLDDVAPAPKPASKPGPAASPSKPASQERSSAVESYADSSTGSEDANASQSDAEASGAAEDVDAAPGQENAAGGAENGPSVVIDAYAGFGIATRSVHMPMPMMMTGVLNLEPGVTPAAEVGLRVTSHPSAPFSFYAHLVYQSALGFAVTETAPLSLPKNVRARSERVALEFAPRWHLASSKLDVAIPIGATVRTLWAEVHTSETPSFSLVGPHVRVEAIFAFTDVLSLRLSPELHYIVMIDQDLRTAGVGSSGPALGGDASVDLRLSPMWSFGVNYRESHALLPAARGDVSFRDIERYLTLRAVGSF